MAIKAVVKKEDFETEVDVKYRDLYTEKNGQMELTGVDGMKTDADVGRIQSALEKERKDHKVTKQKWEALGDRKPDEVVAALERIPELEAAAEGKIDEKKINVIVESRIAAKTGPLERTIKQLTDAGVEKDGKLTLFAAKEKTRTIHDSIREAVGKQTGFQTAALEDALVFGERMLDVTEDGKVITKDSVGVTPGVDAVVWITEMQQKKPHWWGPSSGGGSRGNGGSNGNGGANPFAHDTWNMTEQGKVYNENPARAEQLAKSAGTKVGGMRPAARK